MQNVQSTISLQNADQPKGQLSDRHPDRGHRYERPDLPRRRLPAAHHRLPQRRRRQAPDVADVERDFQNRPFRRLPRWHSRYPAHHLPPAGRQHHRDRRPHQVEISLPSRLDPARHRDHHRLDRTTTIRASVAMSSARSSFPSSSWSSSSSSSCATAAPPSFPASPSRSRSSAPSR
jgi:hypothetical protein